MLDLDPGPFRVLRAVAAIGVGAALGACSSSTAPPGGCAPQSSASVGHPSGVIDSIYPLTGRPFGVAINASGTVLVGRQDANDVVRGSIVDFRFLSTIAVGNDPGTLAMSPDGATGAVANYNDNGVGFIDMSTNTQATPAPVFSNPFQVRYHPDGAKLYVGTAANGVIVINAATHAPMWSIPAGRQLNGLAFTASACELFVSALADSMVTEVNTTRDSILRFIKVSAHPQEIAVSQDGSELWIADEFVGVEVYSLPNGAYLTTVAGTAGAWGLAMTPDGVQLYATLSGPGAIKVIDRASRTVAQTLAARRPRRIAFDASGMHAVVADELLGAILIN